MNLILWVYILLYFTIEITVDPDPLDPLVNLVLWVYILLYFTIYTNNCSSRSPRSISELNFMGLYPIVFHYKDI